MIDLKERVIKQKFVNEHKISYNLLTYGLLIVSLPIQLPLLVLCKMGELAEMVESVIGTLQVKLRDNVYKLIHYNKLPTHKELHGITRKEWEQEEENDKIYYVD